MNLNFMLAGALSAGQNPIMLALSMLVMFAGPAAYVYGADRFLMPRLRPAWSRIARPIVHRPHAVR